MQGFGAESDSVTRGCSAGQLGLCFELGSRQLPDGAVYIRPNETRGLIALLCGRDLKAQSIAGKSVGLGHSSLAASRAMSAKRLTPGPAKSASAITR